MLIARLTGGIEKRKRRRSTTPAGRRRVHPVLPAAALMVVPLVVGGCVGVGSGLTPPLPVPDAAGRPSIASSSGQADGGPGTRLFTERRPVRNTPVQRGALPPAAASQGQAGNMSTIGQPATARSTARLHDAPHRARAFPAASTDADRTTMRPPVRKASATAQTTAPTTIRFTPVIGAPINAIRPLSSALEKSASRKGIQIQTTADSPPDNILRGYFSAARSGNETHIVYVWDVLDGKGNQLYRIQHTKVTRGGGKTKDVWASVPASAMQAIARRTIKDYLTWRASKPG